MIRPTLRIRLSLLLVSVCACVAPGQVFGKNKVQYENWDWFLLESKNFDVYFYSGAEDLARFAAIESERALSQIAREFRYEISDRIPLIIYKSHNDFQTTNVTPGLLPEGVGGFTEFLKHRVVVPYEGDYDQFRHVLHHELIHAVMFDMLYGRSLANLIGGQSSLHLPLWFSEGLAEYASEGWDTKADMFIRDAVLSGTLPPIDYLGGYFAYKGGQSLFRFLGNRYGREKVGELLGKVRSLRKLDSALEQSCGMTMEALNREWSKAMRREYWPEIASREEPEEFARRLTDHRKLENYYNTSPSLSPDGSKVAFLSDRNVYADVYLLSAINGEVIRRLVKGQRSGKFEELHWLRPGIGWSPSSDRIALAAKAGEHDHLFVIGVKDGEVEKDLDFDLDGLFSPAWSPTGDRIAFVGLKDGASDIYYVDLSDESIHAVTSDPFSDTDPSWSPDGEKLVFISDRGGVRGDGVSSTEMTRHDYRHVDVFMVSRDGSDITKITDDSFVEETPIVAPDGRHVLYTADPNGCFNVFVQSLESGQRWPITNVLTGAFDISLSRDGSKLVFAALSDAGWDVFEMSNPLSVEPDQIVLVPTAFRQLEESRRAWMAEAEVTESADELAPLDVGAPDFDQFIFSKETVIKVGKVAASESPVSGSVDSLVTTTNESHVDGPDEGNEDDLSVRPYSPKFSPDLVYGAAAYSQYFGVVGASQIALSDVLGNHQIYISTNLYFDLENSDFYGSYFYLPNRNDYGFSIFHNAFLWLSDNPDFVEEKLLEGGYAYTPGSFILFRDRFDGGGIAMRRPLDRFRRLEGELGIVFIDREFLDLGAKPQHRRLVQMRTAYVTDTALWGITGPMGGAVSRFGMSVSPALSDNQLSFATFDADIRRYLLIGKEYSFALRLFGGASIGDDPQQFFLGGMQNWLNRDLGNDFRIENLDDLYFASFATPLRGANFYAQVGRRVALANIEFRFPLLRHLAMGFPLPIELGNIRGAVFVDVGSAWNSNSDWRLSSKNEAGERVLDDLLLGYGIGGRWNLGFFVLKLDVGWQDDLAHRSKPRWYLTLGPEF